MGSDWGLSDFFTHGKPKNGLNGYKNTNGTLEVEEKRMIKGYRERKNTI